MESWGDFLNTHTNSPTGGAAHWPTPVINNPITAAWQQQYTVDQSTPAAAGTSTESLQEAQARLSTLNLGHTVYSDDVTTHITGHTLQMPSDDDDSDLEDHSATIASIHTPGNSNINFDAIPPSTSMSPNLNLNPLHPPDTLESQELLDEFFANSPSRPTGIVIPLRMNRTTETAATQSDSLPDLINIDELE